MHYREIRVWHISCAKDTPSVEALRERPDLATQKLSWLQRHDRESGDLYGLVFLVEGLAQQCICTSPGVSMIAVHVVTMFVAHLNGWVVGKSDHCLLMQLDR